MTFRALLVAVLVLIAVGIPHAALAGPRLPPTDCWVDNEMPSIPVGAEARYVVYLAGGSGSYSVNFSFGDGYSEQASTSSESLTFSHWFSATGTYAQDVAVYSAGSSARCGAVTTVW